MSEAAACTVRVFWPDGLLQCLEHQDTLCCHLVGVLLRCNSAHCNSMVVAAVIGALAADQDADPANQTMKASKQLSKASPGAGHAQLAVLGTWVQTPPATASNRQHVQLAQSDLWLALQGSHKYCRDSGSTKQQLAPHCSIKDSKLPQGTSDVQVFIYEAQDASCSLHEQPQQQQLRCPPWLIRPSGTVTLASLLQMVQLAHSSIQQYYQRQQRGPVTLQQREQAISRPGTACGTDEQLPGWQVLAPLLAWPCSTGNSSRHGHRGTGLRCWAPISWQSQDQTSATSQDDVSSRQTADTNSACSDRSRSAGLWPGLLQHLVGLVFAVLLMVYQHQLLQLTATAGGALQHRVFQPHIDWLREAHPGGIKLHHETSYLLASAAEAALQLSAVFYTAAWPLLGPVVLLLLAATSAVGGAVTALAVAADLLVVVVWPVEVVYVGGAALHRLQLRCARATWQLLRGKQKVRRFSDRRRQHQQRQQQPANAEAPAALTDQDATSIDEVSVEQLIVGVLLFTPLLGLIPTTTAWYISICCCHAVVWLVRLVLVQLSVMLRMQGLQVLVRRWYCPQQFPGLLMVQLLDMCNGHRAGRTGQAAVAPAAAADCSHQTGAAGAAAAAAAPHDSTVADGRLEAEVQSAMSQQTPESILVSYYHLFFESIGYFEVLRLNVSGTRANRPLPAAQRGWVQGLDGWAKAVVGGSSWGLGLFGRYMPLQLRWS